MRKKIFLTLLLAEQNCQLLEMNGVKCSSQSLTVHVFKTSLSFRIETTLGSKKIQELISDSGLIEEKSWEDFRKTMYTYPNLHISTKDHVN